MSHTPGPWKLGELDRRCVVGPDELVVADVRGWRDSNDAELIAAAPELLEVAKLALKACKEDARLNREDNCGLDYVPDLAKKARAAIKKATS
jgi:hypothetical protein